MKDGKNLLPTKVDEKDWVIGSISTYYGVLPWLCLGPLFLPDKDYDISMIEFWSILISDLVLDLSVKRFEFDYVPFWSFIMDFTLP